MSKNQTTFFDEGYPFLSLKDEPRFIPETKDIRIDRNGNWNPFINEIPMLLPKSPNNFFVGNQEIIFSENLFKYYNAIRRESGNKVFFIRIGTMERLTRRLVYDNIITIVDSVWDEEEEFYGYLSPDIIGLKAAYNMASMLKSYYYSMTGKTRPLTFKYMGIYRIVKEIQDNIFKTVIPNFPLTVDKWEIPHWKNSGCYVSKKLNKNTIQI